MLCLAGYVLAWKDVLDKRTQKVSSKPSFSESIFDAEENVIATEQAERLSFYTFATLLKGGILVITRYVMRSITHPSFHIAILLSQYDTLL